MKTGSAVALVDYLSVFTSDIYPENRADII